MVGKGGRDKRVFFFFLSLEKYLFFGLQGRSIRHKTNKQTKQPNYARGKNLLEGSTQNKQLWDLVNTNSEDSFQEHRHFIIGIGEKAGYMNMVASKWVEVVRTCEDFDSFLFLMKQKVKISVGREWGIFRRVEGWAKWMRGSGRYRLSVMECLSLWK